MDCRVAHEDCCIKSCQVFVKILMHVEHWHPIPHMLVGTVTRELVPKPASFWPSFLSSSPRFVNRLGLSSKLKAHTGCVNTIMWNTPGTKLLSGSGTFYSSIRGITLVLDDRTLKIWDAATEELVESFDSYHRANVFSAHFVPFTGDSAIISCAADTVVRYFDVHHPDVTIHQGLAYLSCSLMPTLHAILI